MRWNIVSTSLCCRVTEHGHYQECIIVLGRNLTGKMAGASHDLAGDVAPFRYPDHKESPLRSFRRRALLTAPGA